MRTNTREHLCPHSRLVDKFAGVVYLLDMACDRVPRDTTSSLAFRSCPVGVYFGMIGTIKTHVLAAPPDADQGTKRAYDFVAGMVGGTLATLGSTPFDVVGGHLALRLHISASRKCTAVATPIILCVCVCVFVCLLGLRRGARKLASAIKSVRVHTKR